MRAFVISFLVSGQKWCKSLSILDYRSEADEIQYIVTYPICNGTMINFVAFSSRHHLENTHFHGPWTSMTETSELAGIFSDWESDVQVLIEVAIDLTLTI